MESQLFSDNDWQEIGEILLTEPFTVNEVVGVVNKVRSKYLSENGTVEQGKPTSFRSYAMEFNNHFGFCLPDGKSRWYPYGEGILEYSGMTFIGNKRVTDEKFSVDLRKLLIARERLIRGNEQSGSLDNLLHDKSKNPIELIFDQAIVEGNFKRLPLLQKIKLWRTKNSYKSSNLELIKDNVMSNISSHARYDLYRMCIYPWLQGQLDNFDWKSIGMTFHKPSKSAFIMMACNLNKMDQHDLSRLDWDYECGEHLYAQVSQTTFKGEDVKSEVVFNPYPQSKVFYNQLPTLDLFL